MPTKERRKKRIFLTVVLQPIDKQRLDEIVRIAKRVNPKIDAGGAIRNMIGDLYGNLWRAGRLPSQDNLEMVDPMRGNGHENQKVEQ